MKVILTYFLQFLILTNSTYAMAPRKIIIKGNKNYFVAHQTFAFLFLLSQKEKRKKVFSFFVTIKNINGIFGYIKSLGFLPSVCHKKN